MSKGVTQNTIQKALVSIASKPMLINKEYAKDLLTKFNAKISVVSSSETLTKEYLEAQKEKAAVSFYGSNNSVLKVSKGGRFKDVQKGSVAVVPVMGAMMRDDYCTFADGDIAGTRTLEKLISQLDSNDNVDGIVFHVDTPGGEAFGNESLSKAIKRSKTPTVVFYEMMASAGVYSFQGVDEIYASEKSSMWGSIGTFITLVDDSEFWASAGIEFNEIYASDSTEKNKAFREARSGNPKPMIEFLDSLNSNFVSDVQNSRPQIKDDGHVFKGKLYNAVEARKIGAIDGIRSLDYAISRARYLSRNPEKRNKNKSNLKNHFDMSTENQEKQLGFFQRLFGANTTAEEAENKLNEANNAVAKIEEENKELKVSAKDDAEKITQLQEENEALNALAKESEETLLSQKEEIGNLKASLEEAKANSEELETKIKSLTKENEQLVAHNKELGGTGNTQTPVDTDDSVSHKKEEKNLGQKDSYDEIMARVEGRKKESK